MYVTAHLQEHLAANTFVTAPARVTKDPTIRHAVTKRTKRTNGLNGLSGRNGLNGLNGRIQKVQFQNKVDVVKLSSFKFFQAF